MDSFGRALAKVLRRRGLRQSDLATLAGLSEGQVSRIINDKARPWDSTFRRVLEVIGTDPGDRERIERAYYQSGGMDGGEDSSGGAVAEIPRPDYLGISAQNWLREDVEDWLNLWFEVTPGEWRMKKNLAVPGGDFVLDYKVSGSCTFLILVRPYSSMYFEATMGMGLLVKSSMESCCGVWVVIPQLPPRNHHRIDQFRNVGLGLCSIERLTEQLTEWKNNGCKQF